jgi:UbiD family decarboxylase
VLKSAVFNREQGLAAVQAARLSGRARIGPLEPTKVTSGPVLENVLRDDAVDALRFPTPRWHADDGGRYIGTQCVVITRDPDSSWAND